MVRARLAADYARQVASLKGDIARAQADEAAKKALYEAERAGRWKRLGRP